MKFAVRLQFLTEVLRYDGRTGSLQVVALSRAERELAELAREQVGLLVGVLVFIVSLRKEDRY